MGKLQRLLCSGAGFLSLFLTGCAKYSQYEYKGMIGKEEVEFRRRPGTVSGVVNSLIVREPDGAKTFYNDYLRDDLKIDSVTISPGGPRPYYSDNRVVTFYLSDGISEPFIKKAQKRFDDYLMKIKEAKRKERQR